MKFLTCLAMVLASAAISVSRGTETNPPSRAAAPASESPYARELKRMLLERMARSTLLIPTNQETTNPPAKPGSKVFAVRRYQVEGNTVLWPEQIDAVLKPYRGTSVSLERIREGLGQLQLLYRQLGFATISVVLPQQRLTNGVVHVQVIEGKLADVTITGNRYFSKANVRRALPSVTTNELLNTKWFQPELDRANANPDRQIYPTLNPGPEPGTSGLTLEVKDRLPLHGHVELNDKSTPGTPLLRVDSAIQYNNFWQLEHQIGLEYNFSPQNLKSDNYEPRFFDQPRVASYSGFYRLPLSLGQPLRETYEDLPVDFGYDQVTHRFHLPPPTGNPELVVYASRSGQEMPTRAGPVTAITNTVLEDLSSQFLERDVVFNENLGAKFTLPFQEFAGVHSSFTVGFDYKSYEAASYTTNLTFASLYALDQYGNRTLVTNETLALIANKRETLDYMPLSLGWSGSRPDHGGSTSLNLTENLFLRSLSSARSDFEAVAGSSKAGGDFSVLDGGLTREQTLVGKWSALLRVNGQYTTVPLISNEQFALGGTGGVRGYQEGANYGDTGWKALFDFRAPPAHVGSFPTPHSVVPAYLRASYFMDFGETYLLDRPTATGQSVEQWGTGAGLYLNAGQHVEARLTLGWALHDAPGTRAGSAQGYFSIGFQF
jgi:hemolysin activation/secretion protein